MLTRKYFPALQKTEILPENPVSETRNHTLVNMSLLGQHKTAGANIMLCM